MTIVCTLVNLFVIAVIARMLLSWFPMAPDGVFGQVSRVLFTVTEPVLGPVRRVVPPLRVGNVGLDLSVMIVIFGLQILSRALFRC